MSWIDEAVNSAVQKLEVCFNNQDKNGITAVGNELYEKGGKGFHMDLMSKVANNFVSKFPQHRGTLDYLWTGIGLWNK